MKKGNKSVVPKSEGIKQRNQQTKTENVNGSTSSNSKEKKDKERIKEMQRKEREKIVLWRSPFTTLKYFSLEVSVLVYMLALRQVLLFYLFYNDQVLMYVKLF